MVRYSVKLHLSSASDDLPPAHVLATVSDLSGVEEGSVVLYVSKTYPKTVSLSFKVTSRETDAVLLERLSQGLRASLLDFLSLSVAKER